MNLQENAQRIGQSLQDKRASLNIDAREAARQIRISEQFVQSMESGEWDKLGPRVYAKGHLLAYARVLKAETTRIEEHFDTLIALAEQDDAETLQRTDLMPVRQSMMERVGQSMNHLGYVAATALIAIPAIFALIIAFQSRDEGTPLVVQTETADEQGRASATDPVLASMTPVIKSSAPRSAIDLTNLGFEQVTDDTVAVDEPPTATPMVMNPVDKPPAEASQIEIPDHPFEVRVSDDVWVEIYNQRGDKLAYGLKQTGWHMQFPTRDGLEVRLGNVSAVTAMLDDQPFDLAPHTRQDLATFSLPQQPRDR